MWLLAFKKKFKEAKKHETQLFEIKKNNDKVQTSQKY